MLSAQTDLAVTPLSQMEANGKCSEFKVKLIEFNRPGVVGPVL